jgi:predicted nucleic acid-binding Zn ribbon protein
MPIYGYRCYEHDIYEEVLCAAKDRPLVGSGDCPKCPKCGKEMERDFSSRDGRQTSRSYGSGFVSDALAINPDQTEEHHKLFPGVDVLPDGRIKFNNYKQHDNYLKGTGFRKVPQRIKAKGVRIDK